MNGPSLNQILKRKWNTFRHNPVGSAIHRIRMLLDWGVAFPVRYGDEKWQERRLRERGYLALLASRPPEAFPPNCADLWFLYQTVRRRKPRTILEFGSGCSTVILAQALWENQQEADGTSRLYSVESDPSWRDVTVRALPSHLQDICDVRYSPVREVDYEGTPAFRHVEIPERVKPDMVYLDGPPLTWERQVAIDLLDLEERFSPACCLVVDGRWRNVLFLKRYFKRRYRVRECGWSFNHSRNRHVFECLAS